MPQIQTVISAFEKVLNHGQSFSCSRYVGIRDAAWRLTRERKMTKEEKRAIDSVFKRNGYYQNYLVYNGVIHTVPLFIAPPYKWEYRFKFLKKEIRHLKNLLEKGYTHV